MDRAHSDLTSALAAEREESHGLEQKWVRPMQSPSPVPQAPRVMSWAAPGELPEGIQGLDLALGLPRMGNKKPLYIAMLKRFVASYKDAPLQLRRALDASDLKTVERMAHSLKGVAGQLAATEIEAHAAKLEEAVGAAVAPGLLQDLVAALAEPLSRLVAALEVQLPE